MSTIKDGIYFRMPEDEYLAVERLSKSGIKRLRISPADFWHESWLNPKPPALTPEQEARLKAARVIGRAYHCARLEPDRFASIYVRELAKEDMPEGTLFTATDMKPELKERELKLSGTTEEQAERLAEAGFPREKLWHLAMADWEAALPEGAIKLSSTVFDEIAEDMRRIRTVPAVEELLTGGLPEVSVFWTCPETGIPMKARFDYLKPDRWVEFKTFANANGKNLNQCIMDAVRFNRYHIDAASYLQAAEAMASGELDVEGEATGEEIALANAIREMGGDLDCHIVFQQKGGVPNVLERRFAFYEEDRSDAAIAELERAGASEEHLARARRFKEIADGQRHRTAVHTKARMEIAAAKRDFLAYSEIYQPGEPWLPFNPSGEITDADFHPNWLEEL